MFSCRFGIFCGSGLLKSPRKLHVESRSVTERQCCGSVTFWYGSESRSGPLSNRSGCGSGGHIKNTDPTDLDPDADPKHW